MSRKLLQCSFALVGLALSACAQLPPGGSAADQRLEQQVQAQLQGFSGRVHVNVSSFEGYVLLTGEAEDVQVREAITQAAAKAAPNHRGIINETVVGLPSGLPARDDDAVIASKIRLLVHKKNPDWLKRSRIVCERQVVYLLGTLTRKEADAIAEIAATTPRVKKVVKMVDYR